GDDCPGDDRAGNSRPGDSRPGDRSGGGPGDRTALMSAASLAAAEAPIGSHRAAVTVCVMLATIMQALDTTIANVALPYMQGSLSATLDQINWVLTSYIVAAAIMTPPTGWLDRKSTRLNSS